MANLCLICGAYIPHLTREEREKIEKRTSAAVVNHRSSQDLLTKDCFSDGLVKISPKQMLMHRRRNTVRLLKQKRLVLILDLDKTLIHATFHPLFGTSNFTTTENEAIIKEDLHVIYPKSPRSKTATPYYVKIRPGAIAFLECLHQYYDLYVSTMGERNYAQWIVNLLDPYQRFIKRIVARNESGTEYKDINTLLPLDMRAVLVLDDTLEVWQQTKTVFHLYPFEYYPSRLDDRNFTITNDALVEHCLTQSNPYDNILYKCARIFIAIYATFYQVPYCQLRLIDLLGYDELVATVYKDVRTKYNDPAQRQNAPEWKLLETYTNNTYYQSLVAYHTARTSSGANSNDLASLKPKMVTRHVVLAPPCPGCDAFNCSKSRTYCLDDGHSSQTNDFSSLDGDDPRPRILYPAYTLLQRCKALGLSEIEYVKIPTSGDTPSIAGSSSDDITSQSNGGLHRDRSLPDQPESSITPYTSQQSNFTSSHVSDASSDEQSNYLFDKRPLVVCLTDMLGGKDVYSDRYHRFAMVSGALTVPQPVFPPNILNNFRPSSVSHPKRIMLFSRRFYREFNYKIHPGIHENYPSHYIVSASPTSVCQEIDHYNRWVFELWMRKAFIHDSQCQIMSIIDDVDTVLYESLLNASVSGGNDDDDSSTAIPRSSSPSSPLSNVLAAGSSNVGTQSPSMDAKQQSSKTKIYDPLNHLGVIPDVIPPHSFHKMASQHHCPCLSLLDAGFGSGNKTPLLHHFDPQIIKSLPHPIHIVDVGWLYLSFSHWTRAPEIPHLRSFSSLFACDAQTYYAYTPTIRTYYAHLPVIKSDPNENRHDLASSFQNEQQTTAAEVTSTPTPQQQQQQQTAVVRSTPAGQDRYTISQTNGECIPTNYNPKYLPDIRAPVRGFRWKALRYLPLSHSRTSLELLQELTWTCHDEGPDDSDLDDDDDDDDEDDDDGDDDENEDNSSDSHDDNDDDQHYPSKRQRLLSSQRHDFNSNENEIEQSEDDDFYPDKSFDHDLDQSDFSSSGPGDRIVQLGGDTPGGDATPERDIFDDLEF